MSGRHSAPEPDGAGNGTSLEILPVHGIGDVTPGDDLAALIADAAPWLRDGDVLVVTSKIVSKAEGRLVDVPVDGPERAAAREETLAAETARPVARRGQTRIVQTHHGFVMAAAGIDASNVDPSRLVLLPKDPDASARALRATLRERHGVDVAIIISDTMGRPWRNGLTDVALGAAGIGPIRDHRGEIDAYGNELHITEMAVVDELAGAGELVKGKCDQVPVAVVRGYLRTARPDDGAGAVALIRDAAQDLFSLGTAEATAAGFLAAATMADPLALPAEPVRATAVARAIAAVAGVIAPGTAFTHTTDPEIRDELAPDAPVGATGLILCRLPAPAAPVDLIRFGADLHRLRAALAAEGVPSAPLPMPPPGDDHTLTTILAV
ncbi:coenzyme F420-0:L-glutamate ligase [Micromonospora sp. NPDC049679]|uniref:coenzyme F420-0:L-glutamate ligase n=1 Tax=Micromonospora sp. NPDC049679 TaxID=3155920 RepID=UPI0033EF7BA5